MIEVRMLGRMGFAEALEVQSRLVEEIRAGDSGEVLLLLEHDPVYTIGRARDQSSLRSPENLPHPVVEINRGGQATYHGPGQLVGYPLLDLRRFQRDLHRYLEFLEDFLLLLSARFGVPAARRKGLTGAWVGTRKLASIGVGVRHWISMHGFAINVTTESLDGFLHIVPCGISHVQMTCLESESGTRLSLAQVADEAQNRFPDLLP